MKKYIVLLMLALALPVLTTPPAFADPETAIQESSVFSDLYGLRRTQEMTVISPDDAVSHSFYGLKIGDKKSDVIKTLRPAFTLMYELKAIGPAYLLSDVVYPDYYLTVSFDDKDRVSMIVYQENKKYHIMTDSLNS
ncbi:MAG: hypothetical protein UCI88_00615 [Megasphaera massiliensis]|uniref:hypothetical protein n=1 Tax=Megasphaera massiliensis TaxID=1232428 RepID=UPI00210A28AC|nr:hypothetical protein [Megasphaera massiliensis]MCQ5210847.1 hypothetical protein [Megasphaera massiliensis]MEE0657594.1 hypothetical protein [Megasphaera massiliensis]